MIKPKLSSLGNLLAMFAPSLPAHGIKLTYRESFAYIGKINGKHVHRDLKFLNRSKAYPNKGKQEAIRRVNQQTELDFKAMHRAANNGQIKVNL